MRFYLRLIVLAGFLAVGLGFAWGRLTGISASISNAEKQAGNAETTLRVMTENCGKCHQSSLPTANSQALAIFDLDKKPWYVSVTDHHLESISKRISTKGGISEADRAATVEFIACLRQGKCRDKD